MSKIEVNAIEPQCGTNLTVGASGDTITFPSGTTVVNNGSQSGFGRTGTVDWDTTAKTASFTAVSGNGYFVNTTSGVITVTLPASPSAGDIVAVADYANTADTNNITLGRNGSNIEGNAEDFVINKEGISITLVYVDATKGWITTDTGQSSDASGDTFIIATGGTITCCGDYKIHTFTGPGTFTVCSISNGPTNNTVDYMVVAGGGGGGFDRAGGGGGGGFRESSGTANGCYTASPLGACVSALPVTAQAYPITIGAGGATNSPPTVAPGDNGSNSVFSTIISTGGGGGASSNIPAPLGLGQNGGSGGGGTGSGPCQGANAGSGNTPPVSPPQGQNGGPGFDTCRTAGGGGGGAGNAGAAAVAVCGAGDGGVGVTTSITGTATKYSGGGGGGNTPSGPQGGGDEGIGGINPGGSRCSPQPDRFGAGSGGGAVCSTAGLANTGGGGGGGGGASPYQGNSGGSGIVVIRYKYK